MKSVFEEFYHFWPESSHHDLKTILSKVTFITYPSQQDLIGKLKLRENVVVVVEDATTRQLFELFALGFEHCVQKNRPDFAQELLAASLMVLRPEAFLKNPIPFFLTGFTKPNPAAPINRDFSAKFSASADKPNVLKKLKVFLSQNDRLAGLLDLCLQVADELFINAIFDAPQDASGRALFKDTPRNQPTQLPDGQTAELFSSISDHRVIIGCADSFGTFRRNELHRHLKHSFLGDQVSVREEGQGAGLGLRYMIENAANFYLYSEQGRQSLVACGFALKGVRFNLSAPKHIHLSIRGQAK